MPTIPARLQRHAAAQPDKTFCTFLAGSTVQTITFMELYARSAAYMQRYRDCGVQRGDAVLIILKHTPHLFYSFLGAVLAGAIPSFMPFPSSKQRPDLYWGDHDALFKRIKPALLVTYEDNLRSARAEIADFDLHTLIAGDDILSHPAGEPDPHGFRPDDLACLQHSSGTTSLKKGVMLTHRAIIEQVESYSRSLAFTQDDSIASWLPLYHDMGFIACFMSSVVQGTTLIALDPFEWVMRPHLLLEAIQRYRTTFCWLPNFAFGHLANAVRPTASWDLSSMRAYINCSEPCKPATFTKFLNRFASCGVKAEQLQVCYAMAENVFGVTQTELGRPAKVLEFDRRAFAENRLLPPAGAAAVGIMSCGRPLEGVAIEIRDAQSRALPQSAIGEICIQSSFLFAGYYLLPEKTAEKLRAGWYSTGDMGFMRDGELFVTGRIDDMLIIAGRNYYAHEIESVVNGVPAVLPGRNVALAVDDGQTDALAVAVLAECAPDADLERVGRDVRREVLEKLGLAVHAVVPLPKGGLIKTTSGKISRSKNLQLYLDRPRDS